MEYADLIGDLRFPQPLPDSLWDGARRSSALTPIYITRYTGRRLEHVTASAHPFWELLVCFNDQGSLERPGGSQRLHGGDLVLIPPGLLHREQSRVRDWDTLWIGLAGSELETAPTADLVLAGAPGCLPWAELLYSWHRRQVGPVGPELDAATAFLVRSVWRLQGRDSRTTDWLERVIDFVQSHLEDPLTVPDLARIAGCSEGHLHRAFREAMGLTPWQYVTNQRLDLATLYLRESGHSIRQIARLVGYRDPLYFSRVFRQHFGCAPSSIRREPQPLGANRRR